MHMPGRCAYLFLCGHIGQTNKNAFCLLSHAASKHWPDKLLCRIWKVWSSHSNKIGNFKITTVHASRAPHNTATAHQAESTRYIMFNKNARTINYRSEINRCIECSVHTTMEAVMVPIYSFTTKHIIKLTQQLSIN